jgi:uroporphyrin-III C-methyltransferase/precorrin-2 dehydrogenase/sirohydrochlorin ferrochelatase
VTHYPVFLDLRGRRCVVLGDSPTADEKAAGLRAVGADVAHLRRAFAGGDLAGAYLAIEATGDPASQARARAEADAERVLLNVVDVTHHCDWIAPAVVRRGPLQVAISTSGESPFLASNLRARLEATIGEEWGPLTELLGRVRRRLRRHGVPMERQVRAYRRLARPDTLALLAAGEQEAAEAVAAAIEADALDPAQSGVNGEVVLVGAGPGDPGLLTAAGRDALMSADVVVHDSLVAAAVLSLCRPGCRVVDAGKRAGRPSAAQEDIIASLIEAARAGDLVVRLKGGDPFVFGRGGEEVAALRAAGVPVRVIPGVSSALAAAASADIPVTHRGVASSVAIVTGREATGEGDGLDRLAREADTLVVLMPGDLGPLTDRLSGLLGAAHPAALVSSATTADQRVVRAPLGGLAAAARRAGLSSPVTLICGRAVDVLAPAGGDRGTAAFDPTGAVAASVLPFWPAGGPNRHQSARQSAGGSS